MSKRRLIEKKMPCVCSVITNTPELDYVSLNDLRLGGLLSDGVVKCMDEEIKIHRIILSSASSYFRAVYTNTLQENEENYETTVEMPSVYFHILLDFAYTGKCNISLENVRPVLVFSDRYEFLGVKKLCCQLLLDAMNHKNCFEILKFAKDYFCYGLLRKGQSFVKHNIMAILKASNDFKTLTFEEVYEILSDDELNVSSEDLVFNTVKMWVEYDVNSRAVFIQELLKCVRIYQKRINRVLLGKIRKWKLINKSHINGVTEKHCRLKLSPPRIPHEVIFAIGGWTNGSPTSCVETFDVRAIKWCPVPHSDVLPRAYHGVCAIDNLIYVIGGFNGNSYFNSVRCFDPVNKTWEEKACMYQPRCYISVATLDGCIYALGGFNGMTRLKSAERYTPALNQWELIASMNNIRSDASAAAYAGKVYIVGGLNGRDILNSAEVFDPSTNQWTLIQSMLMPRSGVSLVAYAGELYALGGYDGHERLMSCEKWNPSSGSGWTEVGSLCNRRSNFAAAVVHGLLVVIGGFDGDVTICKVEYLDENNTWRGLPSMALKRSALSACVLSGLPNVREYCDREDLGRPGTSRDQVLRQVN